jgi:hypothetical protein
MQFVCMCVCVCVCLSVCMSVYVHVSMLLCVPHDSMLAISRIPSVLITVSHHTLSLSHFYRPPHIKASRNRVRERTLEEFVHLRELQTHKEAREYENVNMLFLSFFSNLFCTLLAHYDDFDS